MSIAGQTSESTMKASAAYSDDGKREASCRAPEASHERYNDAAVISHLGWPAFMSGDWTRCLNDVMTGGASSVRCSPVMQTATATCTCFRWGGVLLGEEQSPGCQGLTDGIAR